MHSLTFVAVTVVNLKVQFVLQYSIEYHTNTHKLVISTQKAFTLNLHMYVSTCTLTAYIQCMTRFVTVQCNVYYNDSEKLCVEVNLSLMMHYHTVHR